MTQDCKGQELNVGDEVILRGRVISLNSSEMLCAEVIAPETAMSRNEKNNTYITLPNFFFEKV